MSRGIKVNSEGTSSREYVQPTAGVKPRFGLDLAQRVFLLSSLSTRMIWYNLVQKVFAILPDKRHFEKWPHKWQNDWACSPNLARLSSVLRFHREWALSRKEYSIVLHFLDYYCREPSGKVKKFVPMERSKGYVSFL